MTAEEAVSTPILTPAEVSARIAIKGKGRVDGYKLYNQDNQFSQGEVK